MKLLDLYIARAVFKGITVALLTICAIDWLGDVFYEVSRMRGDDQFSIVFMLTIVDIPHKFFEFLPSSLLIGTLFGLGQYAASSELTAAGAGGYSRLRVGLISCVIGLLLALAFGFLEESYFPYGEKLSLTLNSDQQGDVLLATDKSYWVRDQNRFIRVGQAVSGDLLNDIDIFQFNALGEVIRISRAKNAVRMPQGWQLHSYRSSNFEGDKISVNNHESFVDETLMFGNLLQSVTSDPFRMSVKRLNEYIFYLEDNHLDAREYRIALFKRLAVPFVGVAMILLALPLVFRPRQMGGVGQRLLLGIMMALIIHIVLEALTSGAVVYQFSPLLGAFLPVFIILACSALAFKLAR